MLAPMQAESVRRIRSYLKLNKGRRAGLLGLLEALTIVDAEGSGQLSWKQFADALTSFGVQIQDVRSLFKVLRKDASGLVDIYAFLDLMKRPMSRQRKDMIDEIFYHIIDKNNDGTVSIDEISKAYMAFRHPEARMGRKSVTVLQQDFMDDLAFFSKDGYFNIDLFTSFMDYTYCFEEDVDFMELMKLLFVNRVVTFASVASSMSMEATDVPQSNDIKEIFIEKMRKFIKIRGVKGFTNFKISLKKNSGKNSLDT